MSDQILADALSQEERTRMERGLLEEASGTTSEAPPGGAAAPAPAPTQTMVNTYKPYGPGQAWAVQQGSTLFRPTGTMLDIPSEMVGRGLKAIDTGAKAGIGTVVNGAKMIADGVEKIASLADLGVTAGVGEKAVGEWTRKMEGARNIVLGMVAMGLSPLTVPAGAAGSAFTDAYPQLAEKEVLNPGAASFIRMMMGENPEDPHTNRPFTLRELLEVGVMMASPVVAEAGSMAVRAKTGAESAAPAAAAVRKPKPSASVKAPAADAGSLNVAAPGGPGTLKGTGIEPLAPEQVDAFMQRAQLNEPAPPSAIDGPRLFGMNLERLGLEETAKRILKETNKRLYEEMKTHPDTLRQTHVETLAKAQANPITVERALTIQPGEVLNAADKTSLRSLVKAVESLAGEKAELIVQHPEALDAKQDLGGLIALGRELSLRSKYVQQAVAQSQESSKIVPPEAPGFMQVLEHVSANTDIEAVARSLTSLPKEASPTFWRNLMESSDAGRTKVLRLYQSSLLSSPRTHLKIAESQELRTWWNVGERGFGRMNRILSFSDDPLNPGVQSGETLAMVRAYGKSQVDGIRFAGKAFVEGRNPRLDMTDFALPKGEITDFPARGWTLFDVLTSPGRAVGFVDARSQLINYRMGVASEAVRIAKSEGLTGAAYDARVAEVTQYPARFPSVDAAAELLAKQTSFVGPPGRIQLAFEELVNAVPGASAIFPFKRAPGQLLKFGTQITPGINLPSILWGELGQQIAAGGAQRDLALARIEMGAIVASGAAYLSFTGKITGKGPKENREAWMAQGYRPYSFMPYGPGEGKPIFQYRWAEGLGAPFGLVADFTEIAGELPPEQLDNIAQRISLYLASAGLAYTRHTLDPTYFMTLRDTLDAIESPDRRAEKLLESYGRSAVPAIVRDVEGLMNPEYKEVRSFLDAVMSNIPGNTLKSWRNELTGAPMLKPPATPLNRLTPIQLDELRPDAVLQEVIDQHARIQKTPDVISGRMEPLFSMADTIEGRDGIPLSDEQKERWILLKTQEVRLSAFGNRTLRDAIEAEMLTSRYQRLPGWPDGDGKAKRIEEIHSAYREIARVRLLKEDPDLRAQAEAKQYQRARELLGVGAPTPPPRLAPFMPIGR